jgi:hypothetical protein
MVPTFSQAEPVQTYKSPEIKYASPKSPDSGRFSSPAKLPRILIPTPVAPVAPVTPVAPIGPPDKSTIVASSPEISISVVIV